MSSYTSKVTKQTTTITKGTTVTTNQKYGNNAVAQPYRGTNAYKPATISQQIKNDNNSKMYDRRHSGDTQTKVETMQEGDYIIKVTTTRKIINRDDYKK